MIRSGVRIVLAILVVLLVSVLVARILLTQPQWGWSGAVGAAQADGQRVRVIADEAVAVQTTLSERAPVQHDGPAVVAEVTLINTDTLPPVVDGLHKSKHQNVVDGLGSHRVRQALELFPSAFVILDVNIDEDRFALVGTQQGPPFFRRDSHGAGPGKDRDRFAFGRMDFRKVSSARFEHLEVEGSDIGRNDGSEKIGSNLRIAGDVRVRLNRLGRTEDQPEPGGRDDAAQAGDDNESGSPSRRQHSK